MSFVAELEPRALWGHFDEILKIPRPSKGEQRIRDYVVGRAERAGLSHKADEVGNLVVRKPATPGHENAPITVLQAHLDMVQEKNSDVDHDWTSAPIVPRREGEYLKATGTTLGSDNGIGLASMLAIMEADDLEHGPLELLFTIDEETGLTGAAGLGPGMLEGKLLINCDSEEEDVLTIGCAGGADSHLRLPLTRVASSRDSRGLSIHLSGLKGGHSGIDIHLQRGNALKLMARTLFAASLEQPFRIAAWKSGTAHNAIPREAFATLVVPSTANAERLRATLLHELENIRAEYRSADPDLQFRIEEPPLPQRVWDDATTRKAIDLIHALPHGVVAMSLDVPGLVETSTNCAVVSEKDGRLSILMSSRSSVASALRALRLRIRSAAALAGAEVTEDEGYPGWKPDLGSRLLDVVKKVHEEVAGSAPRVGAVHAGLECGIIGEKYRGMDMISIGPQIEFPHSPDERVKVDSVETFYRILTTVLQRLA